jgi:hypothetical protein
MLRNRLYNRYLLKRVAGPSCNLPPAVGMSPTLLLPESSCPWLYSLRCLVCIGCGGLFPFACLAISPLTFGSPLQELGYCLVLCCWSLSSPPLHDFHNGGITIKGFPERQLCYKLYLTVGETLHCL